MTTHPALTGDLPAINQPMSWTYLGEVEGLQVSLAGAQDKLAQLDAEATRRSSAVSLGMPALGQIALGRREKKESSPTAD